MTVVKAPSWLKKRGRALWESVLADWDYDEHEMQLIQEACRVLDTIDELTAAVDHDGVMIEGSTGQMVLHPAIGERRQQQITLSRLLSLLQLGNDDEISLERETTLKARRAAEARWGKRGKA